MAPTPMSETDHDRLTCDYCGRFNPAQGARCIGCGAPLTVPAPRGVTVTIAESAPEPVFEPAPPPIAASDEVKDVLKTAGAGIGMLGIGSVLLRLAAEGLAIALSAFIIGLNAGSSAAGLNRYLPYLLLAAAAGVLVGLSVALVTKRVFWTLVSAPAGAVAGSMLAAILRLPSNSFPLTALLSAAGAVILALLGGRRPRGLPLRCLGYIRPILGVLGGLLFGLLGFFVSYRIY